MPIAYVSVDVETSGPTPDQHSLVALGACLVADTSQTFYVELRPDRPGIDESALVVSGLSVDHLERHGVAAADAMSSFDLWVRTVVPARDRPVMVALNAPFDWMFVATYLFRYGIEDPFGHGALDLKALFMGATGAEWSETGLRHMVDRYGTGHHLPHHAREDAVIQAVIFARILDDSRTGGERR